MHYIANTLTNHTVIVTKHKGSADNICQAPELCVSEHEAED